MTSGFKLTEMQLVAIYKLEFYKNKKNWKLYEDVKKEPPRLLSPKTLNKLNKTYSVKEEYSELEFDVEQVSPHNKAFLHEEPDDAPEHQPPGDVRPSPLSLFRTHSSPKQIWSGDKTEALWEEPQQDWCATEVELRRDELACERRDGAVRQHSPWSAETHFDLKPAVDPLDLHLDYQTPAQMTQTADDWLGTHEGECADTYDEYELADDSADFVRGAHHAPHSSEIDLSTTQECACTCNNLCLLSVRQLSQAIQRHHSALALLLREQALRERLASHSLLHPPMPFEEHPTRDTDPLRPPDSVLSGSHRLLSAPVHGLDTGRGRGRLQQHRVIGIGMGRPYRL